MGEWILYQMKVVQLLRGWVRVRDVVRGLKRRTFLQDGHKAKYTHKKCSAQNEQTFEKVSWNY